MLKACSGGIADGPGLGVFVVIMDPRPQRDDSNWVAMFVRRAGTRVRRYEIGHCERCHGEHAYA